MKKIGFVFGLVLVIMAAQAAICGETTIGVTGGVNIASLAGDDVEGWDSRTAAYFGGYIEYPFTPLFSLRPELLYTMKGGTTSEEDVDVTAKLDYVEIPVLFKVNVPMEGNIRPFAVVGPGIGFNTGATWEADGHEEDIEDVKAMDIGLIFGGGVGFPVGGGRYTISLIVRYELGVTTIDDSDEEADVKNRTISIGAGLGM